MLALLHHFLKKRDANHWEKGDHSGARFDLCTVYGHIHQHYKQRTIALSTTEAEYLAGTEATKEVVWLQQLMRALGVTNGLYPTTLYGDNQGANALARNPEYHGRTKHIHGRQRFITEMVEQGIIKVLYIPTCNMVADALTKALPRDRYWRCMKMFGLQVVWEDSTILG